MAYIEERELPAEPGKKPKKMYRVRIRIKGMPEKSETFPTKARAVTWATKMEAKIRDGRFFRSSKLDQT